MKDTFGMTSAFIQGGYHRSVGGYHPPNQKPGPCSPLMASLCPPGVQNPSSQSLENPHDSGINSGSDGHSSSPGSENGVERFSSSIDQCNQSSKLAYHSTPIFQRASRPYSNVAYPMIYPETSSTSFPVDVKSEPADYQEQEGDSTLVSIPPTESANSNPLKCLEMSFERNLNMSSSSPAISENSMNDEKRSNASFDEYGENEHHVPRINSHGKIKTFPCKQCSFVASTKLEFWKHRKRNHIKPEKLLTCHLCPFITEYKHHFEYHLRNHEGSKPFKCEHCDYTCVNKSMLNSHKKSHSNVYQYRCADCHYVSKYCHSLKMHLRKHNHQPGMVLNPDGSPNPLPIIDVYGTRRGPKVKSIHEEKEESEQLRSKKPRTDIPAPAAVLPLQMQQFMTQAPPMQVPIAYSFFQQAMIYQNLKRLAIEELSSNREENCSSNKQETIENSSSDTSEALDLTKDSEVKKNDHSDLALKLDTPSTSSDDEEYQSTAMFKYVETVLTDEQTNGEIEDKPKENKDMTHDKTFNCQYCSISFGDAVLYTMHMGYHGYQDPFACNMCGEKCNDKVSFFLHIARTPHT